MSEQHDDDDGDDDGDDEPDDDEDDEAALLRFMIPVNRVHVSFLRSEKRMVIGFTTELLDDDDDDEADDDDGDGDALTAVKSRCSLLIHQSVSRAHSRKSSS